ncbi:MAG: undecaprenyldiphospho-muramoylpentapeptide beta-N-acetylglucosaminyltransferase [Candidatus Cloacimonadaceae bacterium]|nr:undecaprenyldiphospho-muramoylpentapeptide beta-N-acetylglucosaminyltransferase [Candidatus Cloacimonadota bacterium]MDX9950356.1 undecaprenyldiphospho-muramoylpentapeptide beta-N-acetylglucosaminyltransferase [Candidatus Syntrophosphaera sp.]NLN84516.1 undecaprenyldiphospho-muramoylpentapeptide beta-N-acetylglucosaminyltransferase [Candidatus Cloacimonadota bacterium]
MRFIFGAGGTGGHIYPAIAIAQRLRQQGHEIIFIGNKGGMEENLVPREGFEIRLIRVQKLHRGFKLSNLLLPFMLVSSTLSCLRLMRSQKPKAVFCTGGFVSGPVGLAAVMLKIPLYFHESNSLPGITTRHLAKKTRIIFTGFASAAKHLPPGKAKQIGIPLPIQEEKSQAATAEELGFDPQKKILLITGGSQGSQAINASVAAALPHLQQDGWQLIWQTGKTGFDEYSKRFQDAKGVHIFAFSPKLKDFYRLAQVAITRAGALTIAELTQNQLPAILIPLPSAAENHQHHNALDQQARGVALLLPQKDLNAQILSKAVERVYRERHTYLENLSKLPPNTAAQDIADAIIADLNKEKTHAGKN